VEDISDGGNGVEMEETIMWVYNDTSELYHHGVLGMKWGVRRKQAAVDRLSAQKRREQAKRTEVKQKKGVTSRSFDNASKNLNLTKARLNLAIAKRDGDGAGKALARHEIKDAKSVKRHGAGDRVSSEIRRIYGSDLKTKELNAIRATSYERQVVKARVKRAVSVIGGLSVSAAAAYIRAKNQEGGFKIPINIPGMNPGLWHPSQF